MSLPCRSVSGDLSFGIHQIFQKTIRSLGSEEQIAKWDPLCSKFQILGTYAQTEMGHGESRPLRAAFRQGPVQYPRAHVHLGGHGLIHCQDVTAGGV